MKVSKKILSVCLSLVVLLAALPIVPVVFGTTADAETTTDVKYSGGANFRVVNTYSVNSFPAEGGTYPDRSAADDPGTDANPAYYGFSSGTWTYEVTEEGAGKFAYGTGSKGTAYVLLKSLPKANVNMVSFHLDATNAAGSNSILEASINLLFRNTGVHYVAGGTEVYFQPDGSEDYEIIKVTTASSNGGQRVQLRGGVSGTYYIPAVSFGPTTASVSGYDADYSNSTWQNLTDSAVVNGPNWWFSAGVNMNGNRFEISEISLSSGEYLLIDDFNWCEVESIPVQTVMNEYFVIKNEYSANSFPHISLQDVNNYDYDPGASYKYDMYGRSENCVSTEYDSAKGAGKFVYNSNDGAASASALLKRPSVDGVNMLSAHIDLTNMAGSNGVLSARLVLSMGSAGHYNVGGEYFYFLPDATEENPYPSIEKIQIPTSNSVWNVRVPLQAGRAGTYYFPEEVFGVHNEATCGYTNGADSYNTSWTDFDCDWMTMYDGAGNGDNPPHLYWFDSGNCWRNYFSISYFSFNEGEYFYIDDLKWVEAAATGSMLETPEFGTAFVQNTETGALESTEIIREPINSVEMWVNTTSAADSFILTNKWPYTSKTAYHDGAEEVWVKMNADGNPFFHMSDGEGHWIDWTISEVTINNGEWNHLAFVKDDAAKKVYFYMNGFLKSAYAYETFANVNLTQQLLIGHGAAGLSSYGYFDGQIADVRLWNDARTAEEIFSGVTDFANTDTTGLIVQYLLQGDFADSVGDNDLVNYDIKITSDEAGYAAYEQDIKDVVANGGYSIAFLPDTQCFNQDFPSYFDNPYNWIIDNKDAFNIKAVMSLGDITNNSATVEWERAGEQFQRLTDAGIAWTVIQGNHDYNGSSPGSRKYDGFNATFTPETVPNIQGDGWNFKLGGVYFANEVSNAYYYLTVGEVEYMLLCLELEPGTCVMQWADQVLKANCDKRVIFTTHEYMDAFATRTHCTLDADGNKLNTYINALCYGVGASGEDVWNDLVSKNPNIEMVLCGHISSVPIQYRVDKNEAGKDVLQILMDTQGWDTSEPPVATVGIATFSADGNSVSFKYYTTGTYENGKDQYYSADNTVVPEKSDGYFLDNNSNELSFNLNAVTTEYVDESLVSNEAGYNAADLTVGANVFTFDGFIATNNNGWRNPFHAIYGGSTVDKVKWDNGRAAITLSGGAVSSIYVNKLPNFVPINGEIVKAIAVSFDASATTEQVSFRWGMTVPDVQSAGFEARDYNTATATVKAKYILVWEDGTVEEALVGGQRLTLPAGFKGQVILPLDNNFCCWLPTGGANVVMTAEDFASAVAANNVNISIQSHCDKADTVVYVDNITYLTDLGELTHTVVVKDKNGDILDIILVADGEVVDAAQLPDAPNYYGYTFKNWSNATMEIVDNIIMTPVYEKIDDKYYVNAPEGVSVTYPNGQDFAYYDDRVIVSAPAVDSNGTPFAYWEVNGDKFRYGAATTSFLVFGNMEMKAVYAADVAEAPVIFTNPNTIVTDNGNGKFNMHVMGAVTVPDGCVVSEIGIVLAAGEWTAEEVINGTAGTTFNLPVSNIQANRQFVYTIKNIAEGQVRTAVTYAIIDGVVCYGSVSCVAGN